MTHSMKNQVYGNYWTGSFVVIVIIVLWTIHKDLLSEIVYSDFNEETWLPV